jgi:hypothetical protein
MAYAWQRHLFRSADVVFNYQQDIQLGLKINMNLSSSDYSFRSCVMSPGNSKTQKPFWEWQDTCNECARQIQAPRDLFCENFGSLRGNLPICRNAWCAACYKELEILKFPRQLPENDEGFLWKKKRDEGRFLTARKGDMLCAPFQCDFCWFENLKGRCFDERKAEDRLNLGLIRRVNLDVMWDKEPSTVGSMLQVFLRARTAARHLGIMPSFLTSKRAWPVNDQVGCGEAMLLLWDSIQTTQEGRSRQFDTIRKLRSMSANIQTTSAVEELAGLGFRESEKTFVLDKCSTNSVFFSKFIRGCEKRMGRMIRQDAALSVPILLAILANMEREFKCSEPTIRRKRDLVMLGSFLVVGFCDALRGNEVFLVEASNLCKFAEETQTSRRDYIVVPMMGRFKGETGERNVLRVLVKITSSGIDIGKWVARLVRVLKAEGRNDCKVPGPAFCDEQGQVLSYGYVNDLFHEEVIKVQEMHSELIARDVTVADIYNIYRSLRRGATSRATELNYSETLINLNNRWRTTQSNKGTGGIKKMSQLYVEMSLVTESLLQFSKFL